MSQNNCKRYDIGELKHYRNEKLKSLIDEAFNEEERGVAWATVELIKELYPEMEETLRGELIHSQEVKSWE